MDRVLVTVIRAVMGFIISITPSYAVATKIDGPLELNETSPFGTIAFVPGAVRSNQISRINQFIIIGTDNKITLNGQRGYCFIATHYDPPRAQTILSYEFITYLEEDGEKKMVDPGTKRNAPITNNNGSSRFPSYCIYARPSGTELKMKSTIEVEGTEINQEFTLFFE